MALTWDFKEKVGEAVIRQGDSKFTVNLYNGNAYLIFIYEYKDSETNKDMYTLWTFWGDKSHAKNCLGLSKGKTNIYVDDYNDITTIRLDKKKCRNVYEIVGLVSKAFDNITIEIYTSEE